MEMRGMGSKSTTTAGPCITLLQERFRQLKRQREQREEKQVLLETSSSPSSSSSSHKRQHLSSSSSSSSMNLMKQNMINNITEANNNMKGYSFTKDELMIMPTRTCLEDDPLSLGLNNLSNKHINYREMMMMRRNQLIVSQADDHHKRVAFKSNSHKFKTRDLDTSLHL